MLEQVTAGVLIYLKFKNNLQLVQKEKKMLWLQLEFILDAGRYGWGLNLFEMLK